MDALYPLYNLLLYLSCYQILHFLAKSCHQVPVAYFQVIKFTHPCLFRAKIITCKSVPETTDSRFIFFVILSDTCATCKNVQCTPQMFVYPGLL